MFTLLAAMLVAAPVAAPVPVAAKSETEKKVCRKVESTSSRMAKRVCKTESDWVIADKSANAADLKRMGAR
jgi:hypothetical protein